MCLDRYRYLREISYRERAEIAVYKCTHVYMYPNIKTVLFTIYLRTLDVDISFFLTIFYDLQRNTQSSMIYNETHRRKDTLPLTLE